MRKNKGTCSINQILILYFSPNNGIWLPFLSARMNKKESKNFKPKQCEEISKEWNVFRCVDQHRKRVKTLTQHSNLHGPHWPFDIFAGLPEVCSVIKKHYKVVAVLWSLLLQLLVIDHTRRKHWSRTEVNVDGKIDCKAPTFHKFVAVIAIVLPWIVFSGRTVRSHASNEVNPYNCIRL